jgi:hypothetical protein
MDHPEAMESPVGERSAMRATEITIVLHERGSRPHSQLRDLPHAVQRTLARNYRRFRQDAEGR